jgi:hypothetical protein
LSELFIVDVKKEDAFTHQSWGNTYLVKAADLTDAASAAPIIVAAEKLFHFDRINFTQARVASKAADDGVYVTIPTSGAGAQITTGKTMPLFLCLEGFFNVAGFGRPLMKYWHTGFDDVFYDADFTFDNTLMTDAFTAVSDMISDLSTNGTPWCKTLSAEVLTAPILRAEVKAHQFTKASKRLL